MDNLVQQLRSLAKADHDDLSLGDAAADEIESLRQQLAECVSYRVEQSKLLTEVRQQLAAVGICNDMLMGRAMKAEQQLAIVTAERDELAMALHYVKQSVFEDSAAFDIARAALAKAERREAGQLGADRTGD